MVQQLNLFDPPPDHAVNVSHVAQRSPFRYPGGKTWLIPRIYKWLLRRPEHPAELIEPFAGGGGVSLTVAAERLADHVTMIELDDEVAAVWQTIINDGNGEWLARRIEEYELTQENVIATITTMGVPAQERAFQTILKNRTFHGGILAPGSGLLKYGENGRGIASRWYPQTLARRIRDIGTYRDRLAFVQGDGFEVIEANRDRQEVVWFVDPPYTAGKNGKRAGTRLYTHFNVDHERLFDLLATVRGDFLLTYDNDEYVQELATQHGFQFAQVAMTNTHHAEMKELLISCNLSWL